MPRTLICQPRLDNHIDAIELSAEAQRHDGGGLATIDRLYLPREAADLLGISQGTLEARHQAGVGPPFSRFGKLFLLKYSDLQGFMTAINKEA